MSRFNDIYKDIWLYAVLPYCDNYTFYSFMMLNSKTYNIATNFPMYKIGLAKYRSVCEKYPIDFVRNAYVLENYGSCSAYHIKKSKDILIDNALMSGSLWFFPQDSDSQISTYYVGYSGSLWFIKFCYETTHNNKISTILSMLCGVLELKIYKYSIIEFLINNLHKIYVNEPLSFNTQQHQLSHSLFKCYQYKHINVADKLKQDYNVSHDCIIGGICASDNLDIFRDLFKDVYLTLNNDLYVIALLYKSFNISEYIKCTTNLEYYLCYQLIMDDNISIDIDIDIDIYNDKKITALTKLMENNYVLNFNKVYNDAWCVVFLDEFDLYRNNYDINILEICYDYVTDPKIILKHCILINNFDKFNELINTTEINIEDYLETACICHNVKFVEYILYLGCSSIIINKLLLNIANFAHSNEIIHIINILTKYGGTKFPNNCRSRKINFHFETLQKYLLAGEDLQLEDL